MEPKTRMIAIISGACVIVALAVIAYLSGNEIDFGDIVNNILAAAGGGLLAWGAKKGEAK